MYNFWQKTEYFNFFKRFINFVIFQWLKEFLNFLLNLDIKWLFVSKYPFYHTQLFILQDLARDPSQIGTFNC